MDLKEIELGGIYWNDQAQDMVRWSAIVNMVINVRVAENVGKFLST
jgi:hypothetical protein